MEYTCANCGQDAGPYGHAVFGKEGYHAWYCDPKDVERHRQEQEEAMVDVRLTAAAAADEWFSQMPPMNPKDRLAAIIEKHFADFKRE